MATGSIALGALMTGAGLLSLLLAALFLRGLRNLASETFLPRLMARRWPRAAGTIITAEVHESPKNPEGVSFYEPVVRYAYSVGGRSYEQSQLDLVPTASSPNRAQAVVARYPVGSAVTVYYDPRAPQRALIDLTIRPYHVFSALFLSLGIPALLWIGLSLLGAGLQLLLASN